LASTPFAPVLFPSLFIISFFSWLWVERPFFSPPAAPVPGPFFSRFGYPNKTIDAPLPTPRPASLDDPSICFAEPPIFLIIFSFAAPLLLLRRGTFFSTSPPISEGSSFLSPSARPYPQFSPVYGRTIPPPLRGKSSSDTGDFLPSFRGRNLSPPFLSPWVFFPNFGKAPRSPPLFLLVAYFSNPWKLILSGVET